MRCVREDKDLDEAGQGGLGQVLDLQLLVSQQLHSHGQDGAAVGLGQQEDVAEPEVLHTTATHHLRSCYCQEYPASASMCTPWTAADHCNAPDNRCKEVPKMWKRKRRCTGANAKVTHLSPTD